MLLPAFLLGFTVLVFSIDVGSASEAPAPVAKPVDGLRNPQPLLVAAEGSETTQAR